MDNIKLGWYILSNDNCDYRLILVRIDSQIAYANMNYKYDTIIYIGDDLTKEKIVSKLIDI